MKAWLSEVWFWLTHERCEQCRELVIPRKGGRRRPCIYCPSCAPEFYPESYH